MIRLWTPLELDIVDTLTRRVPLLSFDQIVAIWQDHAEGSADLQNSVCRLIRAELCERTTVTVHPRLKLDRPLIAWRPNRPVPDCFQAARKACARWGRDRQSTDVVWASRRAANLFGSTARDLSPENHHDHDLLLAEVFVLYRQQHPALAHRWIGEHMFPKAGLRVKDPDAFLFGDDGHVRRVVESAGHYSFAQVEAFHEHCSESELPYELW